MPAKKSLPVVPGDKGVPQDLEHLDPDEQTVSKSQACQGCELFKKRRVCGSGISGGNVDIMLVGESPSSWSANNDRMFSGRGGKIIRSAWNDILAHDEKNGNTLRMRHMRRWDMYAVQCQVEEGNEQSATISAGVIRQCSNHLRAAVKKKSPKIILAFGATALRALGYKGAGFMETRGRIIEIDIEGKLYKVLPTFSTRHMVAKTGLYSLFYGDFTRAIRVAAGVDNTEKQVSIEDITQSYVLPKTVAEVAAVCNEIINYVVEGAKSAAQCALAVDTETNTVNPHRADAKVLCVSFAWDAGKATAIPLYHREAPWAPEELAVVERHVKDVLECGKPKVLHNAKFDIKFMELRHGWRVNNVAWDSMLGEHLLREDMSGNYSLKTLGRSYFPEFAGYADKIHEIAASLSEGEQALLDLVEATKSGKPKKGFLGFEEGLTVDMTKKELKDYLFGAAKDRKKSAMDAGYARVPLDTLLTYAAIDTDLTRQLMKNQFVRMQKEGFLHARTLMASHAIPGSRALGKMEFYGFRVDRPYLEKIEADLQKVVSEKERLLHSFWDRKGEEFNPNSTQHVGYVLFNGGVRDPETGIKKIHNGPWLERNAKSQQYKTDKKTLKAIAERNKCPFSRTLLEYRAAHKALSGFVHDIKVLSDYDGYLHTSFHLHGTSTGRLSSSNVNMQNQPKKLAGVNIKKIFIPDDPEEELVFNVDWKGAEIRVFTAYADDAPLIKALNDGLDVHSWFTQEVFGIPYEEVEAKKDIDDEMGKTRATVKRVVFGILYGAMAKKIAETAGISEEDAQNVIDKLFARFPSLKGYMDEVVAQIHSRGYVETLFGRRRRFPLQGVNRFFQGQAERRGKNMKIQSTSSDIVLGQLIEIDEHIHEIGGRLCITVHDSLVGTFKKKHLAQVQDFFDHYCVRRVAQKYPWLPVAFAHDIGVGPSYGETVGLSDYLARMAPRELTPEQEFLEVMDEDALHDLRTDEEEEREAVAAAAGGKR